MKDLKFNLQFFSEVINGTEGDDTLISSNSSVAVYAGDGNDVIENKYRNGSYNLVCYDNTLYGDNGNDTIKIYTNCNTTMYGGEGDDFLAAYNGTFSFEQSSGTNFYGGAGNDTIVNFGETGTIFGGTGNDIIHLDSKYYSEKSRNLIVYENGDGNDTIYGYSNTNNTISLNGGTYTQSTVGNNIVISVVDSGTITLVDATDTKISIVGGNIAFTDGDDSYENSTSDKVL